MVIGGVASKDEVSYQRQNVSIDPELRVPASRQRLIILVLSREPAGERCVGGSQTVFFSRQEELLLKVFTEQNELQVK